MQKRFLVKVIVFGALQWVILLAALFAISLALGIKEGEEMGAPPPWGFVVLAIIMVGVSYGFVRKLKLENRRTAVVAGCIWSGMTIVFMALTTVANGTQATIFGNWGIYPLFIGQAVGAMFGLSRPTGQPPVGPPL